MNYIQLTITATEPEQETLISYLSDLGATGFEQKDDVLLAYFAEDAFPSYDVNEKLADFQFQISTVKEQNWNEVWEQAFQPVVVDNFCAVRAHFHEPIAGVQHEIIITPKMSFGTGHHATTFLMMQQMQKLDFKGKSVFDFGTGTGILAILAEKLGAEKILAIDNDEWSFENAKENKERNNCTKIDIQLSSVLPQQSFDMVLANINRNVILQYMPYLNVLVNNNGMLLLSGLLVDDKEDIVEACRQKGFLMVNESEKTNWISLLFEKE